MARNTRNINFRQTPRAFADDQIVRAISKSKRNVAYTLYQRTKDTFNTNLQKLNSAFAKQARKVKMPPKP